MASLMEAAFLCLALNIYHEARNQPVIGQIAVSEVVLNRVADDRYPGSICEVVYQAEYAVSSVGIVMASQTSQPTLTLTAGR